MTNLEVKILSFEDMLEQNDEAIVDFLEFIPEKYWDYALLYVEKVKRKHPCDLAFAAWKMDWGCYHVAFVTLEPGDNLHDELEIINDLATEDLDFTFDEETNSFKAGNWFDLFEGFSPPAGSNKSKDKFFDLIDL